MDKQKFIMQIHYNMCDLIEFTLTNLGNYGKISVIHNSFCKQVWVYNDFPDKYYMIIFPIDLLYINAFKGSKFFLRYIEYKMRVIEKLLSQQSN